MNGYALGPDAGLPGPLPGVKASRASTGGSLTLIDSTIDGGPPRHTHRNEDESFYLLHGRLAVECGDDRFDASAGSFVFLPRGVPHTFHSLDGPARLLLIVTPAGLEDYFAALQAAEGPEEIARIQHDFGIVRADQR